MPKKDLNQDGIISPDEEKVYIENQRSKKKMAWVSLVAIFILTAILLFAPIPDVRLELLSEPIVWFYIAMASIVGAFMGFTMWLSRK